MEHKQDYQTERLINMQPRPSGAEVNLTSEMKKFYQRQGNLDIKKFKQVYLRNSVKAKIRQLRQEKPQKQLRVDQSLDVAPTLMKIQDDEHKKNYEVDLKQQNQQFLHEEGENEEQNETFDSQFKVKSKKKPNKAKGITITNVSRDMRQKMQEGSWRDCIPGVGAYSPRFESIDRRIEAVRKKHIRIKMIQDNNAIQKNNQSLLGQKLYPDKRDELPTIQNDKSYDKINPFSNYSCIHNHIPSVNFEKQTQRFGIANNNYSSLGPLLPEIGYRENQKDQKDTMIKNKYGMSLNQSMSAQKGAFDTNRKLVNIEKMTSRHDLTKDIISPQNYSPKYDLVLARSPAAKIMEYSNDGSPKDQNGKQLEHSSSLSKIRILNKDIVNSIDAKKSLKKFKFLVDSDDEQIKDDDMREIKKILKK